MDSPSKQSLTGGPKLERLIARKIADYRPSDPSAPPVGSPLSNHSSKAFGTLDRDASGSFRVTGRDSIEEIQNITDYLGLSGGADALAIDVAAWDRGKERRKSFDRLGADAQTRSCSLGEMSSEKGRYFGREPGLRGQSPDSSPQQVCTANVYNAMSSMSSEDSFSSDGSKSSIEFPNMSLSPLNIGQVSVQEHKPMSTGVRVSEETEGISSGEPWLKLMRSKSEESSRPALPTDTKKCSSMKLNRSSLPPPPPIRLKPHVLSDSTYDILEGLAPEERRDLAIESIQTKQGIVSNSVHPDVKSKRTRVKRSAVNEPTYISSNYQSEVSYRPSDHGVEQAVPMGSRVEARHSNDARQQPQRGTSAQRPLNDVIEHTIPVTLDRPPQASLRVPSSVNYISVGRLAGDQIPPLYSHPESHRLNDVEHVISAIERATTMSTTEQATPRGTESWGAAAVGRFEDDDAVFEIQTWRKLEMLGSGSFGTVYEAMSAEGFYFAVKEVSLQDQGSKAQQCISQLEQEIEMLSKYQHENIVRYLGTEKERDKLYIFLEFVTKGSLASLYQKHELFESQIRRYTRQILYGLHYLHYNQIVHRDIKCANILVAANGKVKVADFGLARQISQIDALKSCKGSAHWMAPEVIDPRKTYSFPADIWSLGCTVLEMATRRPPFGDMEMHRALWKIAHGEAPSIPNDLSEDAQDFIGCCLQLNPDERPSAHELLAHRFVQHVGGSGNTPRHSFSGEATPGRLQDISN